LIAIKLNPARNTVMTLHGDFGWEVR